VGSITWGQGIAVVYDATYAAKFEPPVLGPIVDVLADLAGGRPALEFAVGTGRVALPLAARGIAVHGIELSPHMAEQLLAKPGAEAVPVTVGDMTTTRVPGIFALVYLVANTIMNVTTQDDQLAVLANAGAHLEPGGCFVVEVLVPQLRRVPPGEAGWVFHPRPGSRRDRDLRRHRGPDRVVASLDRGRRAPGAPLRALPVRLAVRTGPDGQDHRFPAPGPLGGLGPGAVHLRQPKPGRRIREAAVA
jgi:SAM-dependent methyltransferase